MNVYKLPGPTSHDVVARLRRHLKKVRVGHSGTLDPLAEGVLLLCLGRATKFFDFLIECPKTYIATLRLGIVTTTQDTEGDIVSERPVGPVSAEAWRELLKEFEGEIEQLPPMFSARRHQGRHLYDLARAGIEVERAPRRTWVEGLEPSFHRGSRGDFEGPLRSRDLYQDPLSGPGGALSDRGPHGSVDPHGRGSFSSGRFH